MKVDIHIASNYQTIPIIRKKGSEWWMGIRIEENSVMRDRRFANEFKDLLNGKIDGRYECAYSPSEFASILRYYRLTDRIDYLSWAVYKETDTFIKSISINDSKAFLVLSSL